MRNINDASDPAFKAGVPVGAFKGAVLGLTSSQYHGIKSYWSSSDLKYMYSSSPEHFYDRFFGAGKDEVARVSEDMTLGSMVHCLLLTPEEFDSEFFLMPELNLRTNEGRATKEKLLTENAGKQPYTKELFDEAMAMVDAAKKHHAFSRLFDGLKREIAFFWTCPFSHLNFRAKIDAASSRHFVEVKTTSPGRAHPDYWAKHLFDMNYDLSLAHYREGIRQVMDVEPGAFFFVIERPKFAGGKVVIQDYEADASCFETGHHKWLDAVTRLAAGVQKNEWPGYFPKSLESSPKIGPPAWAINKTLPRGGEYGI